MKLAPAALVAAVGACAALAGCNNYPSSPPPGPTAGAAPHSEIADRTGRHLDTCFQTRDIRNHTIADNHTMYLDVTGRGVYRLTMSGACLAGSFSSDPIITRQPPGSSIICRPIDLDLSIGHPGGLSPTPCIVDTIARLTPAEVAALPDKQRP